MTPESIKKLSIDLNRRFDVALDAGNFLPALGWWALSYLPEVASAALNNELWKAVELVVFLPAMIPTGVLSIAVLCALAKWAPLTSHQSNRSNHKDSG